MDFLKKVKVLIVSNRRVIFRDTAFTVLLIAVASGVLFVYGLKEKANMLEEVILDKQKEIEFINRQMSELYGNIEELNDENSKLNDQVKHYLKRLDERKEESIKLRREIDRLKEKTVSVSRGKSPVDNANKQTQTSSGYMTFEVTAYTAGFESTGKSPDHPDYGKTASGAMVKSNHTIACPKDYPYGTKMYIPYFNNTFTCEDRGGAITSGRLDVYMDSLSRSKEFGRRKLEVKVLGW